MSGLVCRRKEKPQSTGQTTPNTDTLSGGGAERQTEHGPGLPWPFGDGKASPRTRGLQSNRYAAAMVTACVRGACRRTPRQTRGRTDYGGFPGSASRAPRPRAPRTLRCHNPAGPVRVVPAAIRRAALCAFSSHCANSVRVCTAHGSHGAECLVSLKLVLSVARSSLPVSAI